MADNKIIEDKYKVDTTQLKIGQVFKNKRNLCEYLGQEYIPNKTASASQLKEWKRYIDWEKDGQKIIITDIYPTPLDKNDGRVTNGTRIYQNFIEEILLAYMDSQISQGLVHMDERSSYFAFSFTRNQLALLLGMINEKYIDKNIEQYLLDEGYTKFNIKDFFARTEAKFSLVITNALNSMQKRKIIDYEKNYMIVENNQIRVATYDDRSKILDAEKATLVNMKYQSIIEVFAHNNSKEYYRKVNEYVKKHFGWDYCYQSYIILTNNRVIDLEKDFYKKNQKNKLELNQKLTTFFNTQAKNKVIKSNNNDLNGFKLPANYKSQQNELADYLLNINNTL